MNLTPFKTSGEAFIYTFPFLIYQDTACQFEPKEISFNEKDIRIYPFFRSGKANFLPMPHTDKNLIPFAAGVNGKFPSNIPITSASAIPSLERDENGKFQMILCFTEKFDKVPKIMPMDSLRINILGNNKFNKDISNSCSLQLIRSIRHKTKQWWLEHHTYAYQLKVSFPILKNGFPVDEPWSQAKGRTIAGDEIPLDNKIWGEVMSDLEEGKINPLYFTLLLDARFFLATADLRRAILDATIACEQARDVHFERLWQINKPSAYRTGKALTGNNLPTHLSKNLLNVTNNKHSYEAEYPDNYEIIKDLWNTRGEIAHGRRLQYYKQNILHTVNEVKTKEFIKCAEHCISWLENL